ncbi:PVC-type heme-binding CxxCH protein [Lignipirellula cremea]|uniref:PVC-type heme-binding CxxCH protein n=1 Tax=Lignipirellula cremea TaxID=2528010 RepID=UPI0018D24F4D|nr:PVC-type heme-binding CxxCH protein [Lignipirellula cremea]
MVRSALLLLLLSVFLPPASSLRADEFALPPGVENTQRPEDQPLSPQAALKRMQAPDGFQVTLFAGEPAIRQPIALQVDDRGRLWVAEFYGYRTWAATGKDRILIFEDTDNDGQYDTRKVFWDEGNYLSGFQLGFGGVYVCCAPHLLFIPDKNGDDQPDGPPQVVLDGWSTKGVHNVVNGLAWGPDGWLYGCNGITAPSLVGKPGASDADRVEMNCGVWRYHPTKEIFEVVAHGTTNPWGLDWNDYGQAFFANCVIEHLWHLIPGAHYKRMFGQDVNPYSYALIESCSDHLHWAGDDWTKARGGKGEHDQLGGGHAHSGTMVYLGDNWPDEYRNSVMTCNIHGNRVNRDLLERRGGGYVAKHGPDFLLAHDEWFRGVTLQYGPDGGVFVTDWTDLGECHDKDGVHRDSGRVYKIVYGEAPAAKTFDVSRMTDAELVGLQSHKNAWWSNHARRVLQERAAAGKLASDTAPSLLALLKEQQRPLKKLRILWTLHAIGSLPEAELLALLNDDNEHVRGWAVQLLVEDRQPSAAAVTAFTQMAAEESSALVRLALASALQRMPLADRWPIGMKLAGRAEDAEDHDLPLMIWYGMEPAVAADRQQAIQLAATTKVPLLRRHIARRLAEK